jgi:hypothetical protein
VGAAWQPVKSTTESNSGDKNLATIVRAYSAKLLPSTFLEQKKGDFRPPFSD